MVDPDSEEAWLREAGLVGLSGLSADFFRDKELLSTEGAEHKVFYLASEGRVFKHTWPGSYGNVPILDADGSFCVREATPAEYRRRLHLQNEVFGDLIREEGWIRLPREKGLEDPESGDALAIVSSQPFRDGKGCSEDDITVFMEENAFRKAPYFRTWFRPGDGVIVSDAHFGNFIFVGKWLIPIDLQLNQVPRDFFAKAGWGE